MLDASHAAAVAATFALGRVDAFIGPVAHGRLGSIWRLDSVGGRFAVKEFREPPDHDRVELDAALQADFLAAGVPMPPVVRAASGDVLGEVAGQLLRVYIWVDVAGTDRHLDPASVGRLLATMHTVGRLTEEPVDDWYAAPVGRAAWEGLVTRLTEAEAPFAARLDELVPHLLEVEQLLVAPTDDLQVCHRDLWADNLRAGTDGGLVVLDWENAGPASPGQELAVLLYEYGTGDPERMRTLHTAYVEAGGPGRLREPGDLTMLVAQLTHILQVGCERWLASTTEQGRADNAAWVREFLDEPVTVPVVEGLLDALR